MGWFLINVLFGELILSSVLPGYLMAIISWDCGLNVSVLGERLPKFLHKPLGWFISYQFFGEFFLSNEGLGYPMAMLSWNCGEKVCVVGWKVTKHCT